MLQYLPILFWAKAHGISSTSWEKGSGNPPNKDFYTVSTIVNENSVTDGVQTGPHFPVSFSQASAGRSGTEEGEHMIDCVITQTLLEFMHLCLHTNTVCPGSICGMRLSHSCDFGIIVVHCRGF